MKSSFSCTKVSENALLDKKFTLFFSLFSGHSATMAGGGPSPHTVYESYHQQFRQLKRQQSSPMGSARQLPMAPFGHRRTASSSSFGGYQQPADLTSPGIYREKT